MTAGAGERVEVWLHSQRPIPPLQLRRLYDDAGWWPDRAQAAIAAVLEVGPAVGAWDGERLVGFARAVSDGRFRAFIEDVVVQREHRGGGVGGRLLDRLLAELGQVETISLFCDPELAPFYETRGFRRTAQVVLHRRGDR